MDIHLLSSLVLLRAGRSQRSGGLSMNLKTQLTKVHGNYGRWLDSRCQRHQWQFTSITAWKGTHHFASFDKTILWEPFYIMRPPTTVNSATFVIKSMICGHPMYKVNIRRDSPLQIQSLSKTTKLLLLDSLLQEVCIRSALDMVAHLWVLSGWVSVFVSHKPCLCRAKESPLKPRSIHLNVLKSLNVGCNWWQDDTQEERKKIKKIKKKLCYESH